MIVMVKVITKLIMINNTNTNENNYNNTSNNIDNDKNKILLMIKQHTLPLTLPFRQCQTKTNTCNWLGVALRYLT